MFLAVTFLYTESPVDPIKDGHFHTCTLQRTGVKLGDPTESQLWHLSCYLTIEIRLLFLHSLFLSIFLYA